MAADPPKLEGDWEGSLRSPTDQPAHRLPRQEGGRRQVLGHDGQPRPGGDRASRWTRRRWRRHAVDPRHEASSRADSRGRSAPTASKIEGTWTQGEMDFPLMLARGPQARAVAKPDQIWEGKLKVDAGIELRLRPEPLQGEGRRLTGHDGQPRPGRVGHQGRYGHPRQDDAHVRRQGRSSGEYTGKLNDAGTEAEGDLEAGGQRRCPLTLKKTDKATEAEAAPGPEAAVPVPRGRGRLREQAGRDLARRDAHPARGRRARSRP